MKIECEVHELVALQRTTELEELQKEIQSLKEISDGQFQRSAELTADRDDLEERNHDLREEIRVLENRLFLYTSSNNSGTGMSMQQVSDLFKAYLGGSKYESIPGTHKIPAIKYVREVFKCGLREAKFIVEGNLENEKKQYY